MLARTLLTALAAAGLAAAQSAVLTFTSVPNPITAGGPPVTLAYRTNDTDAAVTITLRRGAAADLQTVATLTTRASGGSYVWTPAAGLAAGDDYALEIRQGGEVNYFGPFAIVAAAGGSASASSMMAGASGYGSMPTNMPTTPAAGSNTTTMPMMPMPHNITMTGTAPCPSGMMMGTTAAAMPPRNTTMAAPTLSAPETTGGSTEAAMPPPPQATGNGAGRSTVGLALGTVVMAAGWMVVV